MYKQDNKDDLLKALSGSGLIKEIPYFGKFLKVAEEVQNISNSVFIYKLTRFVEDINSIDESALQRISTALECSPIPELAEKIIIAVDSLHDVSKAKYIAQALSLYSQIELSKEDFLRSLDLIQKLYVGELEVLATEGYVAGATSDDLEASGLTSLIGTPVLKIDRIDQKELISDGREDEVGLIRFSTSNFGAVFASVLRNNKPYSVLVRETMLNSGKLEELKTK